MGPFGNRHHRPCIPFLLCSKVLAWSVEANRKGASCVCSSLRGSGVSDVNIACHNQAQKNGFVRLSRLKISRGC